jgi:hypothetical protein
VAYVSVHRIALVPEAHSVEQVREPVQVQVVVVEQMELVLVVVASVGLELSVILNT